VGDITGAGTKIFSLDFQNLGYIDVDRGDRIGSEKGYATEAEALKAAQDHVKAQAADAKRDVVAGAAVVKAGDHFEAYETAAKVNGADVAYNLLYDDGKHLYIPPAYVDAQGIDVVDVVTGAVAPSSATSPAEAKQVVDSSAQKVAEESKLSPESTDPSAAPEAPKGPGFPWGKVGKYTAYGAGGVGATYAGVKWVLPWLVHAGPVASGVTAATVGAGLAYGANKLFTGDNPTVDPVLARRGLAIAGAVTGAAGGVWLGKAVKDSEYLARTPAKRLIGVGVGLALGALVVGELTGAQDAKAGAKAGAKS
jgi:hypothetical protein